MIEEVGNVQSIRHGSRSASLSIRAKTVLEDVKLGDSIAVNGVCLTVTSFVTTSFTADVMHATLNQSALGSLTTGSLVNLERALAVNGRFGGHIVSGHIDGTGVITKIQKDEIAIWYTISANADLMRYIIDKGSITIDGISLTVAEVATHDFKVSLIPHTAQNTNLAQKRTGDLVNIENDCIGKYVEKLLKNPETKSKITKEFLLKYDY